jgi:hypothetical protein
MRSRTFHAVGTVLLVGSAMSGCATAGAGSSDSDRIAPPDQLACSTYYNPVSGAENDQEAVALPVDLGASATAAHPEITLTVSYPSDAYEGTSVSIAASDAEGRDLMRILYQLDPTTDAFRTDFTGGHGFTGLHYVYNAGAELQFWCGA